MELPLNLEKCEFINGIEEVKQTLSLMLKNDLGSFLQSAEIGARYSVHSEDLIAIQLGIEATLRNFPAVTVNSVVVENNQFIVNITYLSENFNINLTENNEG